MRKKIILALLLSTFTNVLTSEAQILKNILGSSNNGPIPSNEVLIQNLRTDVYELNQAKYNNRQLGTIGFKNISGHLERRMQQLGLIRYGTVGYKSTYQFPVGKQISVESKFYVEGKSLHLYKDVLPLPFGATADNNAYIIPRVNEAHAPWTLPIPNEPLTANNMHQKLKPIILNAQERGASAVYFFDDKANNNLDLSEIKFKESDIDEDIKIPIWIISKKAWTDYFKNVYAVIPIQSIQKYKVNYDEGYNIIGLIDNNAAKTVLIMSEYDQILETQNGTGANANSSGVAIMLQLSQILKAPEFKSYNYAFAAFSGSSKGQIGAKSFLSIPNLKSKLAYVIDVNALGKSNNQNDVFMNGLGSAVAFRSAVKAASEGYSPKVGKAYPYNASYEVFLENQIPAISFSTGFENVGNEDNVAQLNFTGMAQNIRFIVGVIGKINAGNTPLFASQTIVVDNEDLVIPKAVPPPVVATTNNKTQTASTSQKLAQAKTNLKQNAAPKTSTKKVTGTASPNPKLAVEETYTGASNIVVDFLGIGINELDKREGGAIIQTVAENSKGAELGFQSGDVLLQIGSFPVFNAKSYLMTIGRFKSGERAYYKVKKSDGKTVMVDVNFQ